MFVKGRLVQYLSIWFNASSLKILDMLPNGLLCRKRLAQLKAVCNTKQQKRGLRSREVEVRHWESRKKSNQPSPERIGSTSVVFDWITILRMDKSDSKMGFTREGLITKPTKGHKATIVAHITSNISSAIIFGSKHDHDQLRRNVEGLPLISSPTRDELL